MQKDTARPPIEKIKTAAELKKWYWLKAELVAYARLVGLPCNCQKPELTERLGHWLETGEKIDNKKTVASSKFDWGRQPLDLATTITDSYRNTQNMRRFMQAHAAEHFAFSNEFMAWMKANNGKTLQQAIDYWKDLDHKKKHEGYREKPLPQNQYNQFSRAISAAKPGIAASDIRRIWAIKRSQPGPHVYRSGDEDL